MFIQTEAAAGGSTMRFFPGRTVLEQGSAQFDDSGQAHGSPLAAALFKIEGVEAVAFDADFIAVGKAGDADWQVLKPPILGLIMEHFIAGRPIMDPGLAVDGGKLTLQGFEAGVARVSLEGPRFSQPLFAVKVKIENTLKNYAPGVAEVEFVHEPAKDEAGWAAGDDGAGLMTPEAQAIQEILQDRVNPAVAAHGGYMSLVDVRDHRAYIRLEGGCQGCGMSNATLSQGVEVEIMRAVPTISQVVDVTDHDAGSNPYYQPGHG